MPCVELGDGRLLDESNSAAWLLSPESMLGGGEKAVQAEVSLLIFNLLNHSMQGCAVH